MLTSDILNPYLVSPDKVPKHAFYQRSVLKTNALEAHSKGKWPEDVINVARPNETYDQKEYRKSVYTPITQTYFAKVVRTIEKIGRADDWDVKFPVQKGIAETETLEAYTTDNFPNFDSFLNWFFSFQLREMCDDPNGVIAVFPYPKKDPDNDAEFLRPFTFWFESEDVIDYQEETFAFLRSAEKSTILQSGVPAQVGLVYYAFDSDSWTKIEQYGEQANYTFTYTILPHNIGYVPCLKIGGTVEEFENGEKLYDSFIGHCLPYWNEALRRYSDQQVQMVLHVHSEKWEIEDSPCKTCQGTGNIRNNYMGAVVGSTIPCSSCHGSGSVSNRSPFNVKQIKPARQMGLQDSIAIPTPPMGYIDKPIDQTKFICDQVNSNIQSGLAAINMEFLMNEPAVNSGIAKSLDRQEMNTFFYTIARHVIHNVLRPCYYYIAKWRYGTILDEDGIDGIMPEIEVPTQFDILTEDILSQRLQAAKQAGVSSGLMAELETEYAKKEFGEDSLQVKALKTILQLDPLPAKSEEEKMTILSNKGTSLNKYILSCNLPAFVNRAYAEDDSFFEKTYADKMEVFDEYVQEIIDDTASQVVPIVNFSNVTDLLDENGKPINANANPGGKKTQGGDDNALDDPSGTAQPTKMPNPPIPVNV